MPPVSCCFHQRCSTGLARAPAADHPAIMAMDGTREFTQPVLSLLEPGTFLLASLTAYWPVPCRRSAPGAI
jgi:hypothetical protein